jgi:multidrug efflux pump subunit AcrB
LKLSHFFIDRPIFAMALSILIVLAGGVAYLTLPVSQYPEIAPPTVQISATYPGADPQVLAETVATPIEDDRQRGGYDHGYIRFGDRRQY